MGRRLIKNNNNVEPTVVVHHSSIALLQERFKQLERVKVMREERELLTLRGPSLILPPPPPPPPPRALLLLEEEEAAADHQQHRPAKWFLHTELLRPSRPLSVPSSSPSSSSSSRLDTLSRRYDRPEFQALELEPSGLSTGFRQYASRPSMHNSWNVTVAAGAADIDTSLHL
ncbi:uncharacterized protein M6B38_166680 [Iris pallida]|uniref:Uncharacterized protein n=1 Tax=Iris pallida TaxID=29817 RepID=A0AAX6EW95_IRIPA|nr:uncharacterized protein M6B38_166680 [Iris pallida]